MGRFHVVFSVVFLLSGQAAAERIAALSDEPARASLSVMPLLTDDAVPPVRIEFRLPSIEREREADGFDRLRAEGLAEIETAGAPELLTTGSLIAVPEGYRPRLEVHDEHARVVADVLPAPRQRRYRCESDSLDTAAIAFRGDLFRSQSWYPSRSVRLEPLGNLHGVPLYRIGIYPVRARPGAREIRVTGRLRATVHFERDGAARDPLRLPRSLFRLVRATTANAQAIAPSVLSEGDREVMLVFTADALKDHLEPLVRWERTKGIAVEVFTYSQAGGQTKALKKFIQDYAKNQAVKPTYLLFVGNESTLPPIPASTASGPAPTDFQYSLFDSMDEMPDALYGRLLADSPEELKTQIDRWIAFEKSPDTGAWYHEAMTIASNEGSNPSDAEYAERVARALTAFSYDRADQLLQGAHTATTSTITSAVESGRSWIAYFGHGDGRSWPSTNDNFDNQDIGALRNGGGRLPFIVDVACLNASFTKYKPCFGKKWVTHRQGEQSAGAVAFYGGSVIISWDPPAIMSTGIAKYHFEKPVHDLGATVYAGQLYLIEQKGSGDAIMDNLRWYNLFGNPSMYLRTATPQTYEMDHYFSMTGQGNAVTANLYDASGAPLEGMRVAVGRMDGQPLAVRFTDAQGRAELPVADASAELVLTVTGYNKETKQVLLSTKE